MALLAACAGAGPAMAGIPATSPIASIQDDRLAYGTEPPAARMRIMAQLGARVVRTDLPWDLVARTRPADPTDPGDPAYDWHRIDEIVAAARRDHLHLLFDVFGTPAWAADPTVTDTGRFPATAVRPVDPQAFGDFAQAAAARYAPQGVHLWEAWNEPNLPLFLLPQFQRVGGHWVNVSARTYSDLAKAFYAGVKRADPTAQVAGLVTAPVGDTCPIYCPSSPFSRTYPVEFLRLLNRPGLRPPMDAVSHHPYPQTGPRDASFPGAGYVDLYNLDVLERALDHSYLRGKPLWLTEVGFSTAPTREYHTWFTPAHQAEYLADAYQRVRRDRRVKILTWYFLQDNPDWTSGLFTRQGRPKPAARAFAFPVAPTIRRQVDPGSPVTVLGQIRVVRHATAVQLQRQAGRRWVPVRRVGTRRDGSFATVLRVLTTTRFRARWHGRGPLGAVETRVSVPFAIRVFPSG